MNTIGYLFILIALLLVRQVFKGRVMNLGEDVTDAFIAVVNGDSDSLGEVLSRTGDSNTPSQSAGNASMGSAPGEPGNGLAAAAIKRGKAAKGYRWAATGPDYYDCSGLMWQACRDLGYSGPRFVTATVARMPGMTRIASPATQGPGIKNAGPNDIVCWPGHHMGVVTGPNRFYSARNPKAGITYAAIQGFRKEAPIYLRFSPPSSAGTGKH